MPEAHLPAEPTPAPMDLAAGAAALEAMLARPRLAGLAVAPDGSLAVVGVTTPAPEGTRMRTQLWALDPDGLADPRPLTRAAPGASTAAFLPDGDLLFTSARPDPDAAEPAADPAAALWRLPRAGGEPELVLAPAGGVTGVWVAAEAPVVVVAAPLLPAAQDLEEDAEQATARDDAEVTALLFEPGTYPVAFWDRWLGPREPALWVLDLGADGATEPIGLLARGRALHEAGVAISPDGTTVVSTWQRTGDRRDPGDLVTDLVAIEVATGERRVLADDGRAFDAPAISPDGRSVVCCAQDLGAPDRPTERTLVVLPLTPGGTPPPRDLTPDLDRWPDSPVWTPDGAAVVVGVDDLGHRRLLRVEVADGRRRWLTDAGAWTDVCLPPAGGAFALRSDVATAPRPVRFDLDVDASRVLPSPAGDDPDVATVERVTTVAEDGTEVGSWLVLPRDAAAGAPVPLVVLLHGGPLSSWNAWHWRWNPHVLAAAGLAVLLPDPALSTGYGQHQIARGWGRWGTTPGTDVLAAVETVAARPEVDADRVAAAGGSFGGYLANWLAGTTDRFGAIVTHASLWSLRAFHGTTDLGLFWEREFGDPYLDASRYLAASPDQHVGRITTPMLVIHGERDLRVPISEGMTLWTDLVRHGVEARLLYLPDEHHWVLKPQHTRLWYRTVLAFLAEHLDGVAFERPELL
ncbi:MAG: alpha/beta fold hydrolase [Nitriliruptoraceae bacterium]